MPPGSWTSQCPWSRPASSSPRAAPPAPGPSGPPRSHCSRVRSGRSVKQAEVVFFAFKTFLRPTPWSWPSSPPNARLALLAAIGLSGLWLGHEVGFLLFIPILYALQLVLDHTDLPRSRIAATRVDRFETA